MSYKVLAICGKAGSGKDTLAQLLVRMSPRKFHRILSATTRPMREQEQEGRDYSFVDAHTFANLVDEGAFLECGQFRGWCYGSLKSSLVEDKVNVGVFNPQGVRALISLNDIDLSVIYLRAPAKERLLRQLNREENPDVDEIIRRYQADQADFAYLSDIEALAAYECRDNVVRDDLSAIVCDLMDRNI